MRQAGLPLTPNQALPTTQLIHGDCLDVMPTLQAGSVQMIFADLPYGVLTWKKWDVQIDLISFWWIIERICQGPVVCTANMKFAVALIGSNVKNFQYDLVFEKPLCSNPMLAKKRPLYVHEHVLVFNRTSTYHPQMRDEKLRKDFRGPDYIDHQPGTKNKFFGHKHSRPSKKQGPLYPRSVLSGLSESRHNNCHPTQKPVALLEWLIKTYTNEGDTVLDPTAGSGTTAVAALRTGRHSICIEKDKGYYDSMCSRVAAERERLMAGEVAQPPQKRDRNGHA